jgi:hypothetical protein
MLWFVVLLNPSESQEVATMKGVLDNLEERLQSLASGGRLRTGVPVVGNWSEPGKTPPRAVALRLRRAGVSGIEPFWEREPHQRR